MRLVWSGRFIRAAKKLARRHPVALDDLQQALQLLEDNPHNPRLRTHALSGDLGGCWACSAGYDLRIVFEFARSNESGEVEIHLLNLGSHDEVY